MDKDATGLDLLPLDNRRGYHQVSRIFVVFLYARGHALPAVLRSDRAEGVLHVIG